MKSSITEAPTDATDNPNLNVMSWQTLLLKSTLLSLGFVIIFLLLTAIGLGIFAYTKFSTFLDIAGLSYSEAKTLITEGIKAEPKNTNGKTTFLVLGIDSVANKEGAPPLTDTILLLSIDYSSGELNGVSLPRDLWSEEYQTKINALYYYGQDRYPQNPEQFPSEVISALTTVPIDYTIVFSLNSITELVEILDGVAIQIPTSFIDTEFPREDINIETTTDEAQLYEVVEFTQGTEIMTPDRVTKYIRSRHSQGDAGTDIDRASRQQLVLSSLIQKLTSKEVLTDPVKLGLLYKWYETYLSAYLPPTDTIALGYQLFPSRNSIEFSSNSLGIYPAVPSGSLEHRPPAQTNNQWTYTIRNQQLFQNEIYDKLSP